MAICIVAMLIFALLSGLLTSCSEEAEKDWIDFSNYEYKNIEVLENQIREISGCGHRNEEEKRDSRERVIRLFLYHAEDDCQLDSDFVLGALSDKWKNGITDVRVLEIDTKLEQWYDEKSYALLKKYQFYKDQVITCYVLIGLSFSILIITAMIYVARRLWQAEN